MEEFDESKPIEDPALIDGEDKNGGADEVTPTIEGSTSDPLARFAKKRQQDAKAVDPNADSAPAAGTDSLTPEAIVERELAEFESLLRPIERFGVNHLESFQDDTLNLELEQFEVRLLSKILVNLILVLNISNGPNLCRHKLRSPKRSGN